MTGNRKTPRLMVLEAIGPYSTKETLQRPDLAGRVGGVYMWCVRNAEGQYLVYYVGKAVDFTARTREHLRHLRSQAYSVHDLEGLKTGEVTLLNEARVGLTPPYRNLVFASYIESFIDELHLFFIRMPAVGYQGRNQVLLEKAIALHLLAQPDNIMQGKESYGSVGHSALEVTINSGTHHLVGITGETIVCDEAALN